MADQLGAIPPSLPPLISKEKRKMERERERERENFEKWS